MGGEQFGISPCFKFLLMDILRKSRVESAFDVVNAGDKVRAEAEAFATATVTFCEDTKHCKPTDDALDMETKTGKRAVGAFLFAGQRMMLGRFSRQAAVVV